jgi:hypothetical protein
LALTLAGGLLAGRAAAQDEDFPVTDGNRMVDMRDGKKPVRDGDGPEVIKRSARILVLRIKNPVHRGIQSGHAIPMTDLVRKVGEYVLETPQPPKKLSESQKDYIQEYGKACCTHVLDLVAFAKEKPKFEDLVRINGARVLSEVARSGYPGCVDVALEIIDNPKENDAVKLYALRALRNAFAAVNSDDPSRSNITNAAQERKAIESLIAFLTRKVNLPADAATDEWEAVRYVRREAIRALGQVRKPVLREDKKIVAAPALWLLRVVAMDPMIKPEPSLSERAEALAGYLQLAPDKSENMDYAVFFVGSGIRDLSSEFLAFTKRTPIPTDPNTKPDPAAVFLPRDWYSWRTFAARMYALTKDWKDAWEGENPNPMAGEGKMITELVEMSRTQIFDPMSSNTTSVQQSVNNQILDGWLRAEKYPSKSLFKDDPNSIITFPTTGP